MNAPSTLAPVFSGGPRAGVRAELDQLERSLADLLSRLKPGRRSSAAVHEEIHRLVLTNSVCMALPPQVSQPAIEEMVQQVGRSHVIDEALQKSTQAYANALGKVGFAPPVLKLLQSWMEMTVDARMLQRQIELKRAIDNIQHNLAPIAPASSTVDPIEPLSAYELGRALGGLSDETVRQRERAGELFSVLRPGRKRGREYPAFQAWPGLAGEPLTKVLTALGPSSGTVAYGFFTSPSDLLGGLTPIEAILGRLTTPRDVDVEAKEFLATAVEERLQSVVKVAEARAAVQAA